MANVPGTGRGHVTTKGGKRAVAKPQVLWTTARTEATTARAATSRRRRLLAVLLLQQY